ncbi:hypothetical protein QWI17_05010, partial [Gilvimarinus sp. SDUM040013]|uniref:hypothetical protein n=1 Tax=Gilvimarinus gilvus TaxID=3058038 RepID=UPI0026729BF2
MNTLVEMPGSGLPGDRVLQMRLGVLGQYRAWHTLQGDVHAMGEVLEALGQVGQARAGRGQVGG